MIGQKFGRLTVVAQAPSSGTKRRWQCTCECGGQTTAFQWSLRAGRSRSCGCLKSEELNRRQGHEVHGLRDTPEYTAWSLMKSRCYNRNHQEYTAYGGTGATVCDEWKQSFAVFFRDVGPRPSPQHRLVRIDEEQPFCAWNTRWLKVRSRIPRRERLELRTDLSVLDPEE